jgi:hypothetical protein
VILKDLLLYLQSQSTLTALVSNKIYNTQAPTGVSMPWIVLEIPAGIREKLSMNKMQGISYARITVDVGPADAIKGSDIIHAVVDVLENYRGNLGDTMDVFMTCGEPRNWAGIGGAYRYQVDVDIQYTFDYKRPS